MSAPRHEGHLIQNMHVGSDLKLQVIVPKQTQGRSAISLFILLLKLLKADIKDYHVGMLIVQGF